MLAEVAFWPARILLLAVIFASPWYYGSVTWQAQTYFVPVSIAILLLAIAGAALRRDSFTDPLVWSFAALLLLALLQTVQLPEWLWQSVSSSAALERSTNEAFTEFSTALTAAPVTGELEQITIQSAPRTLSIHWVQTRASSVMFAIALAYLISASILFRTRNWELVLLIVLAVGGLGIAMLGLLQSVAWNKWTLLPMPTSSYFATFVSRNSAPQYLSIGLGAVFGLLAWWSGSKSDEAHKKYYVRYPAVNAVARLRRRMEELLADLDAVSILCVFSATLIFVAILAASSRGGILAAFAASVLTLCVAMATKQSYAKTVGLVTVMACGGILLLTTLELDTALVDRMDSVNEEAYKLDNGRFTVWQMILSAPYIWLPGCGLGNFHFAILPTYTAPTAWFYHAENIYIELLAEFGVVGFLIGLFGLGWLLLRIRWCIQDGRRGAPMFVATLLAVAAVALQSLVDFSLILPAICLPMAVLVGCFAGRSCCADFGKKVKRQKQHSRKTRDSADPVEVPEAPSGNWQSLVTALAVPSLVLIAIASGSRALNGFAFAEQITVRLKQVERTASKDIEKAVERILEQLDTREVERFADHPEVNLAIGRVYQTYATSAFSKRVKWPREMTATQKASLSEPSSIAAAFRTDDDSRMRELRELTMELPQQIESLRRSAVRMAAAASVSNFDWRGAWGLVRCDLNYLTPESRSRNYARLLQTTLQSSTTPARIGAVALMANERTVGIRFLHDYLERVPAQTVRIASIVADNLAAASTLRESAVELESVLPNSLVLQVEAAEHFSRIPEREELAKQLAVNIDLKQLFIEAEQLKNRDAITAKEWLLVSWLAKSRTETGIQVAAMTYAVSADPMNHALRFELSKLLMQNGEVQAAIEQAQRASRLAPENKEYRDFAEAARP